MSALGSSVINKSSKKVAPKAPNRRTVQTNSNQASARPSVDRRTQSQTPQPRLSPAISADSPAHSIPLATPAPTQILSTSSHDIPSQTTGVTQTPVPSTRIEAPLRTSTLTASSSGSLPQVQQDRVLSSISGSSHPDRVSRSSDEPSTAESLSARTATELTSRDHQPDATVPPSNDPAKATAPTSIRNLGTDISVPATKRRRVIGPEDSRRSATRPETHAPILSTETAHDGIEARAANVTSKQRTTITKKSAPTKGRRKIEAPVVVIDAEDPRGSKVGTTKRRTRIKKGAKIVELDEAEAPLQPSDVSQGPETQEHTPARAEGQKVLSRGKRKNAIQDAAADIVADAVKTSPKGLKRIRRKAGRVATPGDDINVGIAPSEVKMMDLCKDSGIGKLSERETWLREYERAEFVKKKQRELQDIMESSKSNAQTGSAEAAQSSSNPDDGQQAQEEEVTLNVPNTIIVNGQIQIDENSLQIDRHAAAAAERNAEQLSVVEENPYTRKINSGTWLKRDKSGGWNELLIDRLYEGLRMFGTDFQMISKMFPGKTRHSVKLRFCKEEKTNYSRIEAALSGDMVHVDLDKYQAMTGTEYGDPEDLEKEIADDRKRLEQEQAAEKEAMDAAGRERDEQIAAERAKATEESSIGNVGHDMKRQQAEAKRRRMPAGQAEAMFMADVANAGLQSFPS